MLTNLAIATELFHAADETAFADIMADGHRETWPIRSSRFRLWLRRKYYEATGEAPSAGEINSALNLLEARAQFDGPTRAVHIRVAEHGGRVYLDLVDDRWRAVEIGPEGWQVISCPPLRFRRTSGMLPLPVPVKGGSIEMLASFCNMASRSDFVLVISWVLAGLRHGGPYPILALSGEQGSAKTVLSKMLRGLIDPNLAPVRSAPREERDLFIAASNAHLLAFDNLSDLPAWASDALCRLASGGSFATRRLYTNHDEMLFQASRPIVLNGIEDVITRPDLADRAIFVTLPSSRTIDAARRRNYGRRSRRRDRKSLGRCWTRWCMGSAPFPRCDSSDCPGWPISPSGRLLASPSSRRPAVSRRLTGQTGGPPPRMWSRPTRSRLASGS
jgi:hypothetical protein